MRLIQNCLGWPLLLLGFLITPLAAQVPSTGPQAGQKVAFFGDSITQLGWQKPDGYVHLVQMAFQQQGRDLVILPAGVGGNTSKDLLARFSRDILSKKPDWMTLNCGVNDVARGKGGGIPLDQYQANITSIVDQATASGIKVMILTATMIGEDQASPQNQALVPYNAFLHTLAQQKNLPLADWNAAMQQAVTAARDETHQTANLLTVDGIHPNGVGDEVLATGLLKAFGFTAPQIAQARDLWLDLPTGMPLNLGTTLSVRQYLQLQILAASQGRTVTDLVNETLVRELRGMLLKASAPPPKR